MIFHQYYLDCLSQASYLIGDETTGRAVIVDPRRDIDQYVLDAEDNDLTIELVLETHFHADFLSGHLELAAATGAAIGYSSKAETEFASLKFDHGERISLGAVVLEIRHTPGHTPESMSIVIWESPSDTTPYGVLTGDTMFIGDVGRPDLLSSIGYTREELADQLYDSLHTQLLTLPNETRVYPAHGAGSSCGKNLSTDTSSTIGEQRVTNAALLAPTKDDFIAMVTEGQPPAPGYFAYDAELNRKERELLDETEPPKALSLDEFDAAVAAGAMIIDGRTPEAFAVGHIEGAVNVGLNGRYAEFAGSVVPSDADIVLVVDQGTEIEARNRLGRIGFDRVVGFLNHMEPVMIEHADRVRRAVRLTATEFAHQHSTIDGLQLVDIRNPGEVAGGTIEGAITIPVGQLPNRLAELDPNAATIVFCAGGYRSSVAASLLRTEGFGDVTDIIGGYGAWSELAVQPA